MNYFMNLPEKVRNSRFIMSTLFHSTTEPQKADVRDDKNIAEMMFDGMTDTITTGATTIFSLGMNSLNFILPGNLFWNKTFCIMATTKSYVGWPKTRKTTGSRRKEF